MSAALDNGGRTSRNEPADGYGNSATAAEQAEQQRYEELVSRYNGENVPHEDAVRAANYQLSMELHGELQQAFVDDDLYRAVQDEVDAKYETPHDATMKAYAERVGALVDMLEDDIARFGEAGATMIGYDTRSEPDENAAPSLFEYSEEEHHKRYTGETVEGDDIIVDITPIDVNDLRRIRYQPPSSPEEFHPEDREDSRYGRGPE